jgi:hypothetical protein
VAKWEAGIAFHLFHILIVINVGEGVGRGIDTVERIIEVLQFGMESIGAEFEVAAVAYQNTIETLIAGFVQPNDPGIRNGCTGRPVDLYKDLRRGNDDAVDLGAARA